MIRLLIGGSASGKSALAERLLLAAPAPRRILATGMALDFSFRAQIEAHKKNRTPDIPVFEPGESLPEALAAASRLGGSILLESLDFWLFSCHGDRQSERLAALLDSLKPFAGPAGTELIVVSTEIGLGPIPADPATRAFVRNLGAVNQAVAALADDVRLVAAGLDVALKRPIP